MERVGRYALVRRLAIGGMGEIFLARERGVAGFDRLVVVKRLIPELAERDDTVALFIDEARIAANLAHPNIVQIYEFGQDGDAYFLAMEYVPGQNLARICERASSHPDKLFTRELAAHVVAELAHGLDFAHHATDLEGNHLGIVHRDVSPHNLLLSVHGDVKVMDFGIAKTANALHRTATGVIRGKYAYMSPEQLAGDEVDARTDVYSAGVVLWELTLLRRLFRGRDELELLDRVREGKIARPREIDPDYPSELEDIVMAALARDRGRRTGSAGQLAADLRGWLASCGANVQRRQLGALVTTLFPEVEHLAPARPAGADRMTASLPPPTRETVEVPEAQTTPVAPEIVIVTAPSIAAAEVTRTPSRSAHPARRITGGLVLVAAVTAGAWGLIRANNPADDETKPSRAASARPEPPGHPAEVTPIATPPDPDPSFADARPTEGLVAGPPSTASAPEDGGEATRSANPLQDAPARKRRPSPSPAVPAPNPTAPREKAVVAPPPVGPGQTVVAADTPPATGTLLVDATPWGTAQVAGSSPGATPRRLQLAPGTHEVTITLAENGGVFTARAIVHAHKRTKCIASADKGLVCDSPR
jgi:eukaryotic-like serine/threonine-protein kinase